MAGLTTGLGFYMIYITDEEIDKFIKDNIPYWYITTELLGIKSPPL